MRLALLLVVVVTAAGATASAKGLKQPAILYDSALRCASGTCRGHEYDARIYVISEVGLPAKALTTGASDDTNPVWSPDRSRIAFFRSAASPNATTTLWLMKADGSGQRQLTSTPVKTNGFDSTSWLGGSGGPAWSPDGKEIAFIGVSPSQGDLYTIGADGSGLVNLTGSKKSLAKDERGIDARYPSWSPDGTQIAFDADYGQFPSTLTMTSSGAAVKLLFTHANQPSWSHDGTHFAFVRSVGGGRDAVYTTTPTGASQVELTPTSDNFEPSWSPDGTQIVFVRANQIAIMAADGSGIKQLTRHDPTHFVENPDW